MTLTFVTLLIGIVVNVQRPKTRSCNLKQVPMLY